MTTIQVSQENLVCSKCGRNGHNYNDPICDMYLLPGPLLYKTKCSRCNQPGHKRNNQNKCSLIRQYPDYNCEYHNSNITTRSRNTCDNYTTTTNTTNTIMTKTNTTTNNTNTGNN